MLNKINGAYMFKIETAKVVAGLHGLSSTNKNINSRNNVNVLKYMYKIKKCNKNIIIY